MYIHPKLGRRSPSEARGRGSRVYPLPPEGRPQADVKLSQRSVNSEQMNSCSRYDLKNVITVETKRPKCAEAEMARIGQLGDGRDDLAGGSEARGNRGGLRVLARPRERRRGFERASENLFCRGREPQSRTRPNFFQKAKLETGNEKTSLLTSEGLRGSGTRCFHLKGAPSLNNRSLWSSGLPTSHWLLFTSLIPAVVGQK